MYDADNLDPVRHGTIQNQVIAHLKIAKFRGNIRPQPAPSTDYLQAPGSAAQYRQAHDPRLLGYPERYKSISQSGLPRLARFVESQV